MPITSWTRAGMYNLRINTILHDMFYKVALGQKMQRICLGTLQVPLTHSRLRMPQGSPGQGRGMPQGILFKVFDILSRFLEDG